MSEGLFKQELGGRLPLCKLQVFDVYDWDANPQQQQQQRQQQHHHHHARRTWRMGSFSRAVQSHHEMTSVSLTLPAQKSPPRVYPGLDHGPVHIFWFPKFPHNFQNASRTNR